MPLSAGTRLGPYEILSSLGTGGMAEVYRARDTKLDRDVAVKVLPASVANHADALARFEREAKAVAALSHPNILAIHDFGTHAGVTYAVTELLEGETLRRKLDAGPMSPSRAADCGLQIAKGLSAAHERGVVHRDLKPGNVFVTKDGHVKILDFGLAKRIEAVSPDEETLGPGLSGRTEPGTIMGTVGYMSPEQVRGLPADPRSDIFSLGAILYELLTGRKAFERETSGDTMAAILRDEPPELAASGRLVSSPLDEVVRHCLEKNRDRRFQSANDVAFALSEAASATVTTGARVGDWPGRKSKAVPSFALGAVLLFALAGVFLWRKSRPPVSVATGVTRVAVLPFENLGPPEDDYFADGMADEIRAKLTALSGVEVIARGSSTPYEDSSKTPGEVAAELGVGYLLTATVRWEKAGGASRVQVTPELVEVKASGAPTAKWQQGFESDLKDVFEVQSEIATHVARALGMALGAGEEERLAEQPTRNLAAYDAFLKGEAAADRLGTIDPPSVRKALGFYEQAVAQDPRFVLAWSRLSEAASIRYANAVPTPEVARRAEEAAERAVELAPDRPEGYYALGVYERLVQNKAQRAQERFAEGLRLAPGNADLLRGTALSVQDLGRWEDALAYLREAQRLDPRSVNGWTAIGSILLRLRRYDEAREAQEQGLALAPANLRLIEHKAMSFLGEGDLAGARDVLEAVREDVEPTALVAYLANYNDLVWVLDEEQRQLLLRLTPSAFDDDRATWALALAQACALEGDTAKARAYAELAASGFAEQLRAAPNDAGRRVSLGLSLAYLGRKEGAVREGEAGAALSPVTRDARTGAYYQHQLVRISMLVGEPDKALDRLEPLLQIPYYLSPAWLAIDPNFDPLREHPRFRRLVAEARRATAES